jgi:hypothetical protein
MSVIAKKPRAGAYIEIAFQNAGTVERNACPLQASL